MAHNSENTHFKWSQKIFENGMEDMNRCECIYLAISIKQSGKDLISSAPRSLALPQQVRWWTMGDTSISRPHLFIQRKPLVMTMSKGASHSRNLALGAEPFEEHGTLPLQVRGPKFIPRVVYLCPKSSC